MIRRLSVAAVAVVLTGTVASGCSTFTNNREAAKAGGASLSVDEFELILADYSESQAARAAGSSTSIGDTTTTDPTVVAGTSARGLLTEWVTSHILLGELDKVGATIDDATRSDALLSLQNDVPNFAELDAITQKFLIEDQASRVLAANHSLLTDAQAQAVYESGAAESNVVCLRVISFTDEAKANGVYAELQGGADFAALADANSSDASSGTGGVLILSDGSECTGATQFTETISEALSDLAIGQASPPVAFTGSDGSTGYVILMQRPWSEVATTAGPAIQDGAKTAALTAATVHVDSRYGTWDPTTMSVVATR